MSMDTTGEHGGPSRRSLDHQLPPPPLFTGTGQSDLVSTPEAKKSAADTIDHLEHGTKDSGTHADESTANIVKAFGPHDGHGWVTSGALKKAHHTWGEQVQALMNRLGYEKSALVGAKTRLHNTDFGIKHGIARPGSPLDLF